MKLLFSIDGYSYGVQKMFKWNNCQIAQKLHIMTIQSLRTSKVLEVPPIPSKKLHNCAIILCSAVPVYQ